MSHITTEKNAGRPMQDGSGSRAAGMAGLDSAYNFARFLSRDPVAADCIVRAAYLQIRKVDPRQPSHVQLLKVVRDCHSERLAAESLDMEPSEQETDIRPVVDATGLRAAIETLPLRLREILVLKELERLSYREIAEITSLQTGEVMSRLASARRMLAGSCHHDRSESARAG
jgi:DNA-directed RNA polymerase specialized sigma24 family protein